MNFVLIFLYRQKTLPFRFPNIITHTRDLQSRITRASQTFYGRTHVGTNAYKQRLLLIRTQYGATESATATESAI